MISILNGRKFFLLWQTRGFSTFFVVIYLSINRDDGSIWEIHSNSKIQVCEGVKAKEQRSSLPGAISVGNMPNVYLTCYPPKPDLLFHYFYPLSHPRRAGESIKSVKYVQNSCLKWNSSQFHDRHKMFPLTSRPY